MAKLIINIGEEANDGTGDPIRSAMSKTNDNFTELYDNIGDLTLLDLDITDGEDGQVLTANGDGTFSFAAAGSGGGSAYVDADVDVHLNTSTAADDQILSWTGSDYDWIDAPSGGGGSYANADVDAHLNNSSIAAGKILGWNGSDYAWVDQAGSGASYSDSDAIAAVTGADLDMGGNKVLFNNVYATEGDLPNASNYHGMFAHVHGTGAGYFAHGGAWVRLANQSEIGGGGGSSTFAALTEVNTADLDVHDIGVQAKTTHVMTANGSSSYRSDIYGTVDNPTIHVRAGETIAFDITGVTSSHPFQIETDGGSAYSTGLIHIATDGTKTTGASAQGKTSGTLYWKVPGSLSGTYKYICTVHGGMIGDIEIEAAAGSGGGGGSLPSRSSKSASTASIADNVSTDIDITGFKGYGLYTIQTSAAAWVTLYTDNSSRSADNSRAETTDPAPDAGVVAEVITTGAQTVKLSPGTIGYNLESSPTTNIPVKVRNRSGGTTSITVTLNVLQLEA